MTITPEDLVRREVHYCVSSLISTLACNYGSASTSCKEYRDLMNLQEQAMELAAPVDDWEEAAIQEGWSNGVAAWSNIPNPENYWGKDGEVGPAGNVEYASTARELCELKDIEPYQREVFEHWLVSDWLADKLEAKGEKVDKDFAGLTVWARTTTGQGIACDGVIGAICADLNAPQAEA